MEAVHLNQQLIERLFSFVVAIAYISSSFASNSIQLIDYLKASGYEELALDYIEAQASLGLEDYPRALIATERYIDVLGKDVDACDLLGNIYHGMGQTNKAVQAYLEGLDDFPGNVANTAGLAFCLPLDRLQEHGTTDVERQMMHTTWFGRGAGGVGSARFIGEDCDQPPVARIEIQVTFVQIVQIGLVED